MLIEKKFLFELNNKDKIPSLSVKQFNKKQSNSQLLLPGSKSFSNRAIVMAGMNPIETRIKGVLFSEDSYWGLKALETLGFQLLIDYRTAEVNILPPKQKDLPKAEIYLGKAGTLARFFPAVILNWQQTFQTKQKLLTFLTADAQLCSRPIQPLFLALKQLGAHITGAQLPTTMSSSVLAGKCEISGNISGQFLSGLLLTAAGAKSKIQIRRVDNLVQPDYVHMTLDTIKKFGIFIEHDQQLTEFNISNVTDFRFTEYVVEADASTSCYFISLAFLHNFNLEIMNLGANTLQPDFQFVYFLQQLGAHIEIFPDKIVVVKKQDYLRPKGGFEFDFSLLSDQALTMGIIGLFADSPISVRGISHIRHHESDRIACLVKNIRNLGFKIDEYSDGFKVYPMHENFVTTEGQFPTWNDHRFAMSGFILCSFLNNIVLLNPKCVEKTAPHFFQQVQNLGFEFSEI